MKGIRKGINKFISQIFVAKEDEIEIGCPTDVKHIGHIGFDGASGSNPSWMNKLETGPNFALSSIGASGSSPQPLSSRDLEPKVRRPKKAVVSQVIEASSTDEVPPKPRKHRRRKNKSEGSLSSPMSAAGSVKTKSSTRKPKSKLVEGNASPIQLF